MIANGVLLTNEVSDLINPYPYDWTVINANFYKDGIHIKEKDHGCLIYNS